MCAPSSIGPFLERTFDILRRPSALAADASHACRRVVFCFFLGDPLRQRQHARSPARLRPLGVVLCQCACV